MSKSEAVDALRYITGKDPHYQFLEVIGAGGFGIVSRVRRVKDGKIVVCKDIDCSSDPAILKLAAREITTWAALGKEPYIAEYLRDCVWDPSNAHFKLYATFYEGGDVQKVIDRCRVNGTSVHPLTVMQWGHEIASGVATIHKWNIIHRDLKPANVLLARPYEHNEMLWDLSEAIEDPSTKRWATMLSERIKETKSVSQPSCHITDFGLGKFSSDVLEGRHTQATFAGDPYPAKVVEMIMSCLKHEPTERPTAAEVAATFESEASGVLVVLEQAASRLASAPTNPATQTPSTSSNLETELSKLTVLTAGEREGLNKQLWISVREGDFTNVKELLRKGATSMLQHSEGYTPLHLVARAGRLEILRILLDDGADVNAKSKMGGTPLAWASRKGHLQSCQLLVKRGANVEAVDDDGETPLCDAVRNDNLQVAEYLVQDISANIAVRNNAGHTLLHLAASEQSDLMLSFLLDQGLDIEAKDNQGNTPLHHAALSGRPGSTAFLLNHGAVIEATSSGFRGTPLHYAARYGHTSTVQRLLAAGADDEALNSQSNGPLHCAAANGHSSVVEVLVENHFNLLTRFIDERGRNGDTALHLAANSGHFETARTLLRLKANGWLRNKDGKTPREMTNRIFQWRTRAMLKEWQDSHIEKVSLLDIL
ncbi:MAG: hypothetical protein Q9169_005834 [Polycauliona sp. 2 TL-2023]